MTCTVSDIFDVRYGHSLELNALPLASPADGIPFVSRKMGDNGISAYVAPIGGVEPAPAGDISCALGGNGVLTTHLQELPFYAGRDVAILRPKQPMTKAEILFYCLCIKSNRYRYNYGRQANKTLGGLKIPALADVPSWVNDADVEPYVGVGQAVSTASLIQSCQSAWANFRYDKVFDIKKGYYNKKPPACEKDDEGAVPFIGASESNNGVTSYHRFSDIAEYGRGGEREIEKSTVKKVFGPQAITVANNGASVGYAFYQSQQFTCSHDVNPLYLLDREMTTEIGLFLCALISLDRYRWNYGRKWRPSRMPRSIIRLPVRPDGKPDWEYMESYVRTLPYSKTILPTS